MPCRQAGRRLTSDRQAFLFRTVSREVNTARLKHMISSGLATLASLYL